MRAVLDHVGIAIGDLDASLAFFRDGLGLEVEPPEDVPSQRVRAHFISTGPASLELLQATAPDSPIAKFLEKRGPGLHHITLRVDDIAAGCSSFGSAMCGSSTTSRVPVPRERRSRSYIPRALRASSWSSSRPGGNSRNLSVRKR